MGSRGGFSGRFRIHAGYIVGFWRFPKITGTILGVPIIRIVIFWGLYWGSYFGKLPYKDPRVKGPY